jgi:hypothetical protein
MATRSEARLGYVPHFEVTTVDGQHVRYDDIWQRRNLVLVVVTPQEREAGARYASQLEARRAEFEREETTVVVTADAVPKLTAPASAASRLRRGILRVGLPSRSSRFGRWQA